MCLFYCEEKLFKSSSLEALIRERIFLGPISNTGYHQLKCPCCNDWNVRAGFKFENNSIHYSCFNCGLKPAYEENSGKISSKFRKVLNDFGISNTDIDRIVNVAYFNKTDETITLSTFDKNKINTFTAETSLPKNCFRLGGPDHIDIQIPLLDYLATRKLCINDYPLFFSTDSYFQSRIIIPFYRNRKLIYWQARTILDVQPRYLNCEVPKTAVIFNFDQLHAWNSFPLIVCEGVFDAIPVNGIALMGGTINESKIELLKQSRRRLIFIIDRDAIGAGLAKTAISNDWDISFTPPGTDVNKSIQKYGKLWTIKYIMDSIPKTKLDAELQVKLNCKQDNRKKENHGHRKTKTFS